jgi:hypothetical protein
VEASLFSEKNTRIDMWMPLHTSKSSRRETLGSNEFLNDHTYHPSIPNFCHCVTERTGLALSIEVWRHIIHQPPEFP